MRDWFAEHGDAYALGLLGVVCGVSTITTIGAAIWWHPIWLFVLIAWCGTCVTLFRLAKQISCAVALERARLERKDIASPTDDLVWAVALIRRFPVQKPIYEGWTGGRDYVDRLAWHVFYAAGVMLAFGGMGVFLSTQLVGGSRELSMLYAAIGSIGLYAEFVLWSSLDSRRASQQLHSLKSVDRARFSDLVKNHEVWRVQVVIILFVAAFGWISYQRNDGEHAVGMLMAYSNGAFLAVTFWKWLVIAGTRATGRDFNLIVRTAVHSIAAIFGCFLGSTVALVFCGAIGGYVGGAAQKWLDAGPGAVDMGILVGAGFAALSLLVQGLDAIQKIELPSYSPLRRVVRALQLFGWATENAVIAAGIIALGAGIGACIGDVGHRWFGWSADAFVTGAELGGAFGVWSTIARAWEFVASRLGIAGLVSLLTRGSIYGGIIGIVASDVVLAGIMHQT